MVLCSCYEHGQTGSMAEEGSVCGSESLEERLRSLLSRYSGDELRADSEPFCSEYRELVEEYAARWQVPLPQLRILEVALRYFARAAPFLAPNCDHVLRTLSSLALSVFELLLFFDQKNFQQEPLKHFAVTFQECYLALAKHQNVHLLQVERLVRGGGAWASSALQAILSESNLPQNEVDEYISSELPVFFELRMRYLLSCERVSEALALAKCCARHPVAGQHLFFLQVYLTWLHKTSQLDRLHKEVADLSGKDAVHIICSLEHEETDEMLLSLSRAFLSQQLRRGDMYSLCDLIFVWSKLHSRLKLSKQALLEESRQLMQFATNVNSIFPFIRVILQELGENGIQFCVELCANALESCLPCDVVTKSLIYKTIASMLPNDLEVCRACALLVFFLERSVDTYKMVYMLYMHPDQDYHLEYSPIRNHIRFEMLQVLKKDLYFDPEFWNLIALRTNCLKLMSGKLVGAALEELMDEKWISNYCTKEAASRSNTALCQKGSKGVAVRKRHHKHHEGDITRMSHKRLKVGHGETRLNVDHAVKKKGNQGSRHMKEAPSEPLRRSFWRIDRIQDNVAFGYGEQRRTTRLSEKNPPKRRIRTPKWLLEDSGTLEENNVPPKIKKHGLKHGKHHRSSVVKGSESGQCKNNTKAKVSVSSHLKARENTTKQQKGFSGESLKPAFPPQVILEFSLPDNELMGTFTEDICNRQRGYPPMLLYKPIMKLPAVSQPVKAVHRKEVVLRARDATMFVQQMHCYARRQKGKGKGLNIHGSVSTITRSSVQGSPPKEPPKQLCENHSVETKVGIVSKFPPAAESSTSEKDLQKKASAKELVEKPCVEKTSAALKMTETSVLKTGTHATETISRPVSSQGQICGEPAVEMKVTIASQSLAETKVTQSPVIDEVTKARNIKDVSNTAASAGVLRTSTAHDVQMVAAEELPPLSSTANVSNTAHPGHRKLSALCSQSDIGKHDVAYVKTDTPEVVPEDSIGNVLCKNELRRDAIAVQNMGASCEISETKSSSTPTEPEGINDISALTLVTEMVTEFIPKELARDLKNHKQPVIEDSASRESTSVLKAIVPQKIQTTSSCLLPQQGASAVADTQGKYENERTDDMDPETPKNSDSAEPAVESEESKLEFCCTFCNKEFKGHRVVVHAMFHYRKDECMFCKTMFKDDLLAMMHLSDHIEKLKRSKESVGNKTQENLASETKETSTPKTSAKAKITNVPSRHRSSGRKCAVRPEPLSKLESSLSQARKLRSNDKPAEGRVLQKKEQIKHLDSKAPFHKVNGHIGKKKALGRMKRDTSPGTDFKMESSTSMRIQKEIGSSTNNKVKGTESLQVLKTKPSAKAIEEKQAEPQEKVHCPADGCAWFTDQSKNRVALLYHALDDHYGDAKPLELSFQIGNNRCSICMRVLWSFEHFQHHVERHRLAPRHPCLHRGCTARFKTGMEMRRHARRHSPLQAVCCLPGCPQLFICLWALNLHEREHYTSKPTKPLKNTNVQANDKPNNAPVEKKQDHKLKDSSAASASVKTRKLRGQVSLTSPTEKQVTSPPPSTVESSSLKQERNEDSNVLKNLSNKDTIAQSPLPNLRFRHTLRKGQVAKSKLSASKTHKVFCSSSLLKHNSKVRLKLKKKHVRVTTKGPKRRGRPPKSKKAVCDENTTTGQNEEAVKDKTAQLPMSPPETAETSTVSNKLEMEEEQKHYIKNAVKTIETSTDESKAHKSLNKLIRSNHIKQKTSHNRSTPALTAKNLNQSDATAPEDKTQKLSADKVKKSNIMKKRPAPEEDIDESTTLDASKVKKHKVTNGKVNTKSVNKKCPRKEPGVSTASTKPDETAAGEGLADDAGKTKVENAESTHDVLGNGVDEITPTHATSTEKKQKLTTKEKSKSHTLKDKNTQTASSNSGKAIKKHKISNEKADKKTVKKRQPCKDQSETPTSKKATNTTSKSVLEPIEDKAATAGEGCLNSEVKVAEVTLNTTLDSSGSFCVFNSVNETTSPPSASEEKKPKKVKKSQVKQSDSNQDGDVKKVKKKRKDEGASSAAKKPVKSKIKLQQEVKAEEGTGLVKMQDGSTGPGYSVITNGQAAREEEKSTVSVDALAEYGKKPYMRLPPTAYLDEKFITMPKRRREAATHQPSQRSPPLEKASGTAALQQRQRCVNCFATFDSVEELQSHLQLQRCSNDFGFDSDDEGNS